jgi:hypothetical protein
MAEQRFYVRVRGKVLGPFAVAQLRQLRDRGQLKRFHEVSTDRQQWEPAAGLAELFADEVVAAPSHGRTAEEGLSAPSPPQWYYAGADGGRHGPVGGDRLRELWKAGTLTAKSLVWKEGMDQWQPLSNTELSARFRTSGAGVAQGDLPGALKQFLGDPVGGLPGLCHAAGNAGALVLGLGLGVMFDLCVGLAWLIAAWEAKDAAGQLGIWDRIPLGANRFNTPTSAKLLFVFKLIVAALLPIVSLTAAITFVRTIRGKPGKIGFDALIAGAAILPTGLFLMIAIMFKPTNVELSIFLFLLFSCPTVLILYSGFTRVNGLSDRGALLAVPAALAICFAIIELFVTKVLLD